MSGPVVTMLRPAGRAHRRIEMVWGTVVTIDVREVGAPLPPEAAVDDALERAAERMRHVDRVFSPFREDSLTTALRTGARTADSLDVRRPDEDDMLRVLAECRMAKRLTGGCFDPWAVPGGFDPSGFVKGWAAEWIADGLVEAGLANVCVNAGGDVVTRGLAGPDQPWVVGIRHPDHAGEVVRTYSPGRGSVATSGVYERGAHIVDPRTGEPARGARAATVVGPDAGLAEILATALVVAGRDGADWFAHLPGWRAFAVDPLPLVSAWSIEGPAER